MATTSESIEAALRHPELEGLVGLVEDQYFEAKSAAGYDLSSEAGRYELAKDVAAFANGGGGWLLVGLTTVRSDAAPIDTVESLDLCAVTRYPARQPRGLLGEYISPSITDLRIDWYPRASSPDLGILAINIPAQPSDNLPFLIAKVVAGSDRLKEIVAGYVVRNGDNSEPMTPERLRRSFRHGMSSVTDRLNSLDEKVGLILDLISQQTQAKAPVLTPAEVKQQLADRIRRAESR